MSRLTVLISTINDRIQSVPKMLLPRHEDISYLVSFQYTLPEFLKEIPDELTAREDVLVLPHPSMGLSVNRNNSLRNCRTELAVLADDDTVFTIAQLEKIIETFDAHPEVQIACFQAYTTEGKPLKNYADHEFNYEDRPRGTYFSSCEIALRTDVQLPSFDTRFGLGSEYLSCGEEEVFIHMAYKSGLAVRYFPYPICKLLIGETTGQRFQLDTRVRRSKGAVLYVMHGFVGSVLRIAKTAMMQERHKWRAFRDMWDGIMYMVKG